MTKSEWRTALLEAFEVLMTPFKMALADDSETDAEKIERLKFIVDGLTKAFERLKQEGSSC